MRKIPPVIIFLSLMFVLVAVGIVLGGGVQLTDCHNTVPVSKVEGTNTEIAEELTYFQYLQSIMDNNGKVKIAVIGSSVTKGTGATSSSMSWPSRLKEYLLQTEELTGGKLELVNFGFSGFKAADLLRKGKVDELIKEKPDLIIFETCIINNYRQSSAISDTYNYIDIVLNKITKELTNSKILLVSPNPILTTSENQIGLTYYDYQWETEQYLLKKGYNYINIYEEINRYFSKENKNSKDYMADQIHPNNQGYKLWFEILLDHLLNKNYPL